MAQIHREQVIEILVVTGLKEWVALGEALAEVEAGVMEEEGATLEEDKIEGIQLIIQVKDRRACLLVNSF